MGDFKHNIDVLVAGKGVLYVGRRATPGHEHEADKYLPCSFCYTFFIASELWRHAKRCPAKTVPVCPANGDEEIRMAKDCITASRMLIRGATGPTAVGFSLDSEQFVTDCIDAMHSDDVSRAVKSDSFLLLLGKVQYAKLGSSRASQVREKMRISGRIKIILRQTSGLSSANIADFISPDKFDACVAAVKSLAGVSDDQTLSGTQSFGKPSVALKAGQLLNKLAGLQIGIAIRTKNTKAKTDAVEFVELYNNEWSDIVSGIAKQSFREKVQQERHPATDFS